MLQNYENSALSFKDTCTRLLTAMKIEMNAVSHSRGFRWWPTSGFLHRISAKCVETQRKSATPLTTIMKTWNFYITVAKLLSVITQRCCFVAILLTFFLPFVLITGVNKSATYVYICWRNLMLKCRGLRPVSLSLTHLLTNACVLCVVGECSPR